MNINRLAQNTESAILNVELPQRNTWVHCVPGSGKTSSFFERFPDVKTHYSRTHNHQFYNGLVSPSIQVNWLYDDITTMDLHGQLALCQELLKVCDRYPINCNVKNGYFHSVRPQTVTLTSNYPPEVVFKDVPSATLIALLRRFSVVELVLNRDVTPPPTLTYQSATTLAAVPVEHALPYTLVPGVPFGHGDRVLAPDTPPGSPVRVHAAPLVRQNACFFEWDSDLDDFVVSDTC